MIVSGIVKTSLLDFPGKIATVLFTPGCNYDCYYCHNRKIIQDLDKILDLSEIEDFLQKRVGFIDGVCITGGEPTLQKGLIEFLQRIKAMGFSTKLDSNGSHPDVIAKCIEQQAVDYFAIDYKAPFAKMKDVARGECEPDNVLKTIAILEGAKANYEVRTTVIPDLSLDDLIQMAKELPEVPKYVLNPYKKPLFYKQSDADLVSQVPYSENQIKEMAQTIVLYQKNIVLPF